MSHRGIEPPKRHFVYQNESGDILLEEDSDERTPEYGDTIFLPRLLDEKESLPYLVTDVIIAPKNHENVTIYIEVKPLRRRKRT